MPRSILLGRPWPAPGEPLFTPEDTDWAIAHQEYRASLCHLCGLPLSVCRDPDNQFRFIAEAERCHAANALYAEQERVTGSESSRRATAWSARLRPATPVTEEVSVG